MDLRKNINFKSIDPSPEEISQWRSYIIDVLTYINFNGDMQIKAGKIIERSLNGWDRCPNDFEARVKQLIGHQSVNAYEGGTELKDPFKDTRGTGKQVGNKPKTKQDRYYQEAGITSEVGIEPADLFSPAVLSSEELAYMRQRERDYRSEFDFNNSSDVVLLNQVLTDELMLRRIQLNRLKGERVSESDVNKAVERIRGALKELGVTRAQRMELDQDVQGNVGQLSLELEKTLNQVERLRDKEKRDKILKRLTRSLIYSSFEEISNYAQEVELQRIHDLEYPNNKVSL
jgi:hypothetical protein